MPGFGVGDHQVARHPVAMHRDRRLRERAGARAGRTARCQARAARSFQADAELALHAPVGEQRELAPQQRVVVGRQRRSRRRAAATARARRSRRASARRPRAARRRSLQRVEVERAAEVAEQQEALRSRRLASTSRRMQPGRRRCSAATCDERAHVLVRRRRVHHDERAARRRVDAEVAPKARVGRCRRSAASVDRRARAASQRSNRRGVLVGPASVPGSARSGCAEVDEASMDNRFYKALASS